MMNAVSTTETSVNLHKTTQANMPEESFLILVATHFKIESSSLTPNNENAEI
jgi:hypothetical protein